MLVLQAAAGGQPGLRISLEEETAGECTREVLCTRVDLPSGESAGVGPKHIQEAVSGHSSGDPTGIHSKSNIDNHTKVHHNYASACRGSCLT